MPAKQEKAKGKANQLANLQRGGCGGAAITPTDDKGLELRQKDESKSLNHGVREPLNTQPFSHMHETSRRKERCAEEVSDVIDKIAPVVKNDPHAGLRRAELLDELISRPEVQEKLKANGMPTTAKHIVAQGVAHKLEKNEFTETAFYILW